MEGALKQIIKDRDYHLRVIEENLGKIENKKESIRLLEEATKKEAELVKEFNRAIEFLKVKCQEESKTEEQQAGE